MVSAESSRPQLINARGTFTPLGVSRSSPRVAAAAAAALADFAIMEDLQAAAGAVIARLSGAEAGTVVHCAAAAITLAVAATMTGTSPDRVAALPDTLGMRNRVVLPATHAVNYGHPIQQAVRLAGAVPVIVGASKLCTIAELTPELEHPDAACLLLVSSRLVHGEEPDLDSAVAAAHSRGLPVILDGAAQDFRMRQLLATGADLVLVSAQKYLGAPTAGLVMGRANLVAAVRAQEKGIGRGMKATKEAIAGVLAALAEREELDIAAWAAAQARIVDEFTARAGTLPGLAVWAEPDPTGLPFPRAHLRVDPDRAGMDAPELAMALRAGRPSIWVMDHRANSGELVFELVALRTDEVEAILDRLAALMA
ncbi:aminotransferase class V-fold PLP-dependent enzyme [Belnapia sp. F-4-1]|uniref:aminotransferase class V-fold PLP-dependent enzyme n=1 Tax=Belnapia sp. F-4-1 TaxID=1545443 RepID=UPI0005BA505A|nr:aminotransferase class V-fold PLP-dependent enzyme [Belnapia sp. F-4-1]